MRQALLVYSQVVLLVVSSACTVANSSGPASDVGKSTGGRATGGTGAAAGNFSAQNGGTAGSSIAAGNAGSAGSSPASADAGSAGSSLGSGFGGSAGTTTATANGSTAGLGISPGSGNSAGTTPQSGGQNSVSGGPATGGVSAAGNATSIGGSSAAGRNGTSLGGSSAAGRSGTSLGGSSSVGGSGASIGGSSSVGGGTPIGGSSSVGSGGAAGTVGSAKSLSPTVFVFERKVASDRDHLVAMDYMSGEQRVITTLAEGSVAGWSLNGVTVSPDRTRIVIASMYGATAADNATGLATNRLWNLDTEGKDFRRLTPVFPNTHPGQLGWHIDVRDPAYSPDGQFVVFDYGEGDSAGGYVAPWVVAADGNSLPSLFETNLDCSVNNNAAFNPVTGDLLLEHAVCIGAGKVGFYSYPSGGGAPDYLVNDQGMSLSSEPPAFSADGSVFVYSGTTYSDNIMSLYAYIVSERRVVTLIPGGVGIDILNATFSPDNTHMVYCVKQGDAYDLRLVDFGVDPPTDSPLTNDGISCDAVF
jgi:hypothetical protein